MLIGIILVILVIFAIVFSKESQRIKETEAAVSRNETSLSGFNATKTIKSPLNDFMIKIDEDNEKIAYIFKDGSKVFAFEDIISVELLESGMTVSKKSTSRTIGGALLGGVLAGGAGMVVGGLSGGSKERRKVTSIIVKVTLRDVSNPSLNIVCFENEALPPYSDDAGLALFYRPAQEIVDTLNVIIDKVDGRFKQAAGKESSSNASVSEEILKLRKMLDDGIITEEEFSKLKAKLIQ